MSLVTLIRDYVDVANSTEKLDGDTLSSLAYHTIIFFFTVAKQAVVYCFTFHWLRDLSYFCFTPPLIVSSFTNVGEIGNFMGVENQPLSHLLAFSDFKLSTGVGIVFLGFFNGCFSCMHLSAAHLVTIRRMLVQGVPAGLCSAFGTALGQFVFLACIFLGFRGVLLPWLALEPVQFLMGTGIILSVASTMAQDRRTPTIQWSAKSSLFFYACTNATLAWCEQAAIFQWMGNISLGAEPTFLETTPSLGVNSMISEADQAEPLVSTFWGTFGTVQQLAQNVSYLFAFLLGSVIGASLIAFILQRFLELVLRYKKIAVYYGLIKQANLPLATLIFAFGFGSMPYYGFDYLVTKGFGFVPQESFFKQTLFSPINLVSKTSQAKDSSQSRLEDQLALFFTLEGERSKSLAVDTTPFDDGQYLKSSQKRPQAFEDLNYRGEHLWTNRLSRISNIREQANQTQSSFLGPIFSWMRSFLWGDGPAVLLNSNATRLTESRKTGDKSSVLASTTPQNSDFRDAKALDHEKKQTADHFINDKNSSSLKSSRKKELSSEMEESDNYLKEFDRQFDKGFSNFYDADPHSLIEVEDQWQEKRIKEKCYTNPIYKFLLNTEIDAFLARQPNSHWLSPEEEILLLKRRQLLGNYYDTLALTNQVSTSAALEQLVPKSYANTNYNHQFKGTLKTARRLFSVKKAIIKRNKDSQDKQFSTLLVDTPEITEQEQSRVVKFDQPLFSKEKEKKNTQRIVFHEELGVDHGQQERLEKTGVKGKETQSSLNRRNSSFSDKNRSAENNVYDNEIKDSFSNIDLANLANVNKIADKNSEKINIFSLEQAESTPLYAGWDEECRKFVLTNRYQNRALAGYTFSENAERFPANLTKRKTTVFTTWPIPNPLIQTNNKTEISSFLDEDSYLDKKEYFKEQKPTFLGRDEIEDHLNRGGKKEKTGFQRVSKGSEKTSEYTEGFSESLVSQKLSSNLKSASAKKNKNLIPTNHFLFKAKPATNDMVNALLQWQKLIKENKQLSKEDKQVAREKVSYWPENVNRANWSNELIDNDIEFDEPTENVNKKKTFLWEFTPPYHGGFVWSGTN